MIAVEELRLSNGSLRLVRATNSYIVTCCWMGSRRCCGEGVGRLGDDEGTRCFSAVRLPARDILPILTDPHRADATDHPLRSWILERMLRTFGNKVQKSDVFAVSSGSI